MVLKFLLPTTTALLQAGCFWLVLIKLTLQVSLNDVVEVTTPTAAMTDNAAALCQCRPYSEYLRSGRECRLISNRYWPDHTTYFGDRDFACLPEHPVDHGPINYRECYRVQLYQNCPVDGYTNCFLNPRSASKDCDSEDLAIIGNTVRMTSPRYDCRTSRGHPHRYRGQELCIYNVSLNNCENGIEIAPDGVSILEDNDQDSCQDYIELIFDQEYHRICGNNFTDGYSQTFNATRFVAVFWSNRSKNRKGFSLRVSCATHY